MITNCPLPLRNFHLYVKSDGKLLVECEFTSFKKSRSGKCVMLASDFLNYQHLRTALLDQGYSGPIPTKAVVDDLARWFNEFASSEAGQNRMTNIAELGGWDDVAFGSFVLGEVVFPAGAITPPFIFGQDQIHEAVGTLDGWKNDVALPATNSTVSMLFICAALAAPFLRIVSPNPGGFGLIAVGRSGTGKTTALRCANSVLARNLPATFNGTFPGLLELAQQYNDLPLCIDSAESMSANDRSRVRSDLAHSISTGIPRGHTASFKKEKGLNARKYRVIILATEECEDVSIRRRQRGEEVRLMDIIVPSKGVDSFGIVDIFPLNIPEGGRRAFVEQWLDRIERGLSLHSGVALPRLISKLIGHTEQARTFVSKNMAWFMTRPQFEMAHGDQRRMLKQFALFYGAGMAAIKCGILPWSREQLLDAITKQAHVAISTVHVEPTSDHNATELLTWLSGARRCVPYRATVTAVEVGSVDFLTRSVNGKRFALVRGERVGEVLSLPPEGVAKVIRSLLRSGADVRLGSEKQTKQLMTADGPMRFYEIGLPPTRNLATPGEADVLRSLDAGSRGDGEAGLASSVVKGRFRLITPTRR